MKENKTDIEDIDIVKKYFSRVFTVIPKEIRDLLKNLKMSKNDLKSIIQELSFLSIEQQKNYLMELINNLQKSS